MAIFKVSSIIDGDTFAVSPGWKWNGQTGSRVRPTGYDASELGSLAGLAAKKKLADLILNKTVELGKVHTIDRGRLVCDVYYGGKSLAEYFQKYKL